MRSSFMLGIRALLLAIAAAACADAAADPAAAPGAPLPGLTEAELARFREGEALFNRIFTPEMGLGPLFNENQCSACHTSPATGGTGDQLVVRATRFTGPDACDPLSAEGGENVRIQATPLLRAHGITAQAPPAGATEQARFNVTFLYGLGLVEAIPDAEIARRADPDDRNRDGISGRVGRDAAGRPARFGRKADAATIADFTHTALRFEMGLTTSRHPDEGGNGAQPLPPGVDPAPDPEVSDVVIERLVDFVRFLAPPARRTPIDSAEAERVAAGEHLFGRIGCAACHTPVMTTGRHESQALDRRPVRLYSDLLLHDLGPQLRTVCAPGATPDELRTAPLMGLRHRRQLLHDGRAHSIEEAIDLHGGEAAVARARFLALPELQRHALVQFLGSL